MVLNVHVDMNISLLSRSVVQAAFNSDFSPFVLIDAVDHLTENPLSNVFIAFWKR